MFLDDQQLRDLTGYKRRREQRQWLADNHFEFEVRRDGRPCVLVDQLRERQGVKPKARSTPGPDLSWLDKAG